MNVLRDYVGKLSAKDLFQIIDSWEKFEKVGVTPMDSAIRVHLLKAVPGSNSVLLMKDLAFEVYRHLYRNSTPALVGDDNHHHGTDYQFSLPPGKYWIGDPCYVLNQGDFWDRYCEISCNPVTHPKGSILNGKFTISGITFGTFSTLWGDGSYPYDVTDDKYAKMVMDNTDISVDSGTIGIVPYNAIVDATALDLGIVVEFEREVCCSTDIGRSDARGYARKYKLGNLYFGGITVYTGDDPDKEDEEWVEEDESVGASR